MSQRTEAEIMKNWKGDKSKPLVSICTITYNHEAYIAEALDSFLMQETDFPFEMVIDDDCSPDNTAEVIKTYIEKYPNIINVRLREKNVGSMTNFTENMQRARGKYIALCEGDDYWTDPLKLQKQMKFLEGNDDYTGYAHNSKVLYQANDRNERDFSKNVSSTLVLNDFLQKRKFHTASFVFRSKFVKNHSLPLGITSGDRALFMLIASFGPIKYINESMGVYRKHAGGISSWVTSDLLVKDLNIIPWILEINPNFPKVKYRLFIYETIMMYPSKVKFWVLLKYYILFVYYSFAFFPKNIKSVSRMTRHVYRVMKTLLYKHVR